MDKNQTEHEILPHEVYVPPKDPTTPTDEEIQKAYHTLAKYVDDPMLAFLPISYEKFPEEQKKVFECVDREMNHYMTNKMVMDPGDLQHQVISNFHRFKKT